MSVGWKWWAIVLAAGTVAASCPAAWAATGGIPVRSAQDLMLPTAIIPSGFTARQRQSFPLTTARLAPWTGRTVLNAFEHQGYVAGYHTVLYGPAVPGMQFVAANVFAFTTDSGALIARSSYQHLIVGTPIMYSSNGLPKSAMVWTYAGTAQTHTNYVAARIVFRVANVVGDVTGFYVGSASGAVTTALHEASGVVDAYVRRLGANLTQGQRR